MIKGTPWRLTLALALMVASPGLAQDPITMTASPTATVASSPTASPTATATPTPTAAASPTPTPVATPTPTPDPTPDPTQTASPTPSPTANPDATANPRPGDGSGDSDSGESEPPTPTPLPTVRPARPVHEINKASLKGPLSWLYGELQAKLASQGIVLDGNFHQTNLDPGVTILSSYDVDTIPPEYMSIMIQIMQEKGYGDVAGDTDYLVAPPGGAGALVAAEAARAGQEQTARDEVQRENDRIAKEAAEAAEENSTGNSSQNPEDVPDLTDGEDGGDGGSGSEDDGGSGDDGGSATAGDGTTGGDAGNGAVDTGDTPNGSGDGGGTQTATADPSNPESYGVHVQGSPTDNQRGTLERALAFFPANALKGSDGQGVSFRWANQAEDGPNTAGVWSSPPPGVTIYPIGHESQHTHIHELSHQWIEGTRSDGHGEFMQVYNSLSDEDKLKTVMSRYAASEVNTSNPSQIGGTGGHELAAEALAFYLQNKPSEFGQPQAPARERLPQAIVDLFARWSQEAGGAPS